MAKLSGIFDFDKCVNVVSLSNKLANFTALTLTLQVTIYVAVKHLQVHFCCIELQVLRMVGVLNAVWYE